MVFRLIRREKMLTNFKGFGIYQGLVKWIKVMLYMGLGLAIIWLVSLYLFNVLKIVGQSYYLLWSVMVIVLNVLGIAGIINSLHHGRISTLDLGPPLFKSTSSSALLTQIRVNDGGRKKMEFSAPKKYPHQINADPIVWLVNHMGPIDEVEKLQNMIRHWMVKEHHAVNVVFDDIKLPSNGAKQAHINKSGNVIYVPYQNPSSNQYVFEVHTSKNRSFNEIHFYTFRIVAKAYSFHLRRIDRVVSVKEFTKDNKHFKSLQQQMQVHEIYKDPELDLVSVADKLEISGGYLSKMINTNSGLRFNDFVNAHRVNKAKELMQDRQYAHYSILGFGVEAGFNSKSTFYSAFRKKEGVSPGQYLKNYRSQVAHSVM